MALRRADADAWGQAETFNDMAVALGALGRLPEAVARYTDALGFARAAGDAVGEAMILKNRASDQIGLGDTHGALADLRDALGRFRAMGNRHEEGVTLFGIGNVALDRGDPKEALRNFETALAVLRETGDRHFEAYTHNHMGSVHLAAHRPAAALREFRQSGEQFRACEDSRGEAMARGGEGQALLDAGRLADAREVLRDALAKIHAAGDGMHEAATLQQLARTERALGDLDSARAHLEEAIRLTESMRGAIPGVGERAAFVARAHERYDLLVDVLMALHALRPGAGLDAEALHVSERAKARSLVDLLAEARVDLREGVDPRLLEEERALEARIERRRREDQRRLAGDPGAPSDPKERPLAALLADYEDLQGRLRAASPRYAALVRPQPLTLAEIREQVLDGDTLLVEYALGEERSFVWAVTRDALTSAVLPGRAVVETAARRLYEAWSAGHTVDEAEAARRARALSAMLLGPVADRLGSRRLAVVAEGALQVVPFAALPSPGPGRAAPLAATHEVVSLPSATTLAVLRREASSRKPPEPRVAVLADPVFDRRDPRVLGGRPSPAAAPGEESDALTRSMHETGLTRLDRLGSSRKEAEAIAALAGRGGSVLDLDFRANRSVAMGADVATARIVHFASHGLLNARHPELSGVVLSLVDEKGRAQDGFLQTRDVYKMKLSAELVVLSACQTALGKDVRGEGLLGLSRGFMYAGAPRIVASLWPVPDRVDVRAHEGLLRGDSPPGAAPGGGAPGRAGGGPPRTALGVAVFLGGVHDAGGLELKPKERDADPVPDSVSELVRRIRAGDGDAESELVSRYGRGVGMLIRRSSRDASVVDDLYQQTFQVALEKIRRGDVREPEKLSGFIVSLARNLVIDHFRKAASRRTTAPSDGVAAADPAPGPLESLMSVERAALVRRVLAEMPSERDRRDPLPLLPRRGRQGVHLPRPRADEPPLQPGPLPRP